MRQSMNRRNTARWRPHRAHRVYARTPNFRPARCCFSINAFLANVFLFSRPQLAADTAACPANGNPSARSNASPSSSVCAVVAKMMSIPRTLTIRS